MGYQGCSNSTYLNVGQVMQVKCGLDTGWVTGSGFATTVVTTETKKRCSISKLESEHSIQRSGL